MTEGKHCSVCGKILVKQEEISANGHSYESSVTKQPTCTEKGVLTYTCSACGDSYTEDIEANGHTIVIDKAVAPTCIKTGLTEGKHCSICGEVLVEQETLSTIDHNYVNGVCTMCGKRDQSYATKGLVFTLSDNRTCYSVTGYTGTAKDVYIPAVYQGLPVTCIGYRAFFSCTGLTSITIPDSVTSVGESAFFSCNSLKGVYITDLEAWCAIKFENSTGNPLFYSGNLYLNGQLVTELVIPDGVTSIGDWVFYGCDNLTSVTIPDGVISIGYGTFEDCDSLTGIIIPDSVISIGDRAFADCGSLTSITVASENPVYHGAGNCIIETTSKTLIAGCGNSIIPSDGSVTSIGNYAFAYCYGLISITIPDGVISIGDYAFVNCYGLISITIPDSVTSIGDYAFFYCSKLTRITIGNGVRSIGQNAFYSCSSLTGIIIPDSVTSIGESAFHFCNSLTSVIFEDPNGWRVYKSSTATRGTSISSRDLSDPSTAASYLTSTYRRYYWKKG